MDMLPGSAPGGRPTPVLHVHPTAYRYTGDASPSVPGGMAVIYKDLIASDERNQQVIADVLTAIHQNRNCLVLTSWTGHLEAIASALRTLGHDPVKGRKQGIDLALPPVQLLWDQQSVRRVVSAQGEWIDATMRLPFRQAPPKIGFQTRSGLIALLRIFGEEPHGDGRQRFWDCAAINRRDRLTRDVSMNPLQRVPGDIRDVVDLARLCIGAVDHLIRFYDGQPKRVERDVAAVAHVARKRPPAPSSWKFPRRRLRQGPGSFIDGRP